MITPGSNRGTKNYKNKLSEEEVIAIFNSSSSQSELASKYKVAQSTIHNIKNRKTWKWLTDNL